jgi:hypothetical protein
MIITEKPGPAGEEKIANWPAHDPTTRENCLREDLTRRLTTVCAGLSGADFEALVHRMIVEQLRGERVMTRVFNHG